MMFFHFGKKMLQRNNLKIETILTKLTSLNFLQFRSLWINQQSPLSFSLYKFSLQLFLSFSFLREKLHIWLLTLQICLLVLPLKVRLLLLTSLSSTTLPQTLLSLSLSSLSLSLSCTDQPKSVVVVLVWHCNLVVVDCQ